MLRETPRGLCNWVPCRYVQLRNQDILDWQSLNFEMIHWSFICLNFKTQAERVTSVTDQAKIEVGWGICMSDDLKV